MARRSRKQWFSALPEGCISHIISLTSPGDAGRLSVISTGFRSAADSDVVWDRFLPSDYQEIISRSVSAVVFASKKELYLHLCRSPILLDGGTKSFALDNLSGKKSYMLAARELTFTCKFVDTPHNWIAFYDSALLPKSRISEVAHLEDVCRVDIEGKMDTRMLSLDTTYGAYLVYLIEEDEFGFENPPMYVSVSFVGSGEVERGTKGKANFAYLQSRFLSTYSPRRKKGQLPQERGDGWMEIEIGKFFNDRDHNGEVYMHVRQMEGMKWDSFMHVQGIELRPKGI